MCCWTVGISSLRHARACKSRRRGGVLWKWRVFGKNGYTSVSRHAPCSQRRHGDLWPESNAAHPLQLDWDRRTHRVLYKRHRYDPHCVVHRSLNSSTRGRIKKDHWVLREARGCSNSDVPVILTKPSSGHSAVRASCPSRTRIHFMQLDKSIFLKKRRRKQIMYFGEKTQPSLQEVQGETRQWCHHGQCPGQAEYRAGFALALHSHIQNFHKTTKAKHY